MTPKNWKTFQHYSDRKPAWIKLHRALLDDYTFSCLPLASQALAPRLWLLASEYDDGKITAGLDEIAFRVHCTVEALVDALEPLIKSEFFIDDSGLLAPRKQSAMPERERETQVQTEEEKDSRSLRSRDSDVSRVNLATDWPSDYREQFWRQYPRKVGKRSVFKKLDVLRREGLAFSVLMAGVAKIPIGEPKFIPHPITWLNQGRWDDEALPFNGATNAKPSPSQRAYAFAERARELERTAGIGRPLDAVGGDDVGGELARAIPNGSG